MTDGASLLRLSLHGRLSWSRRCFYYEKYITTELAKAATYCGYGYKADTVEGSVFVA